MNNLLHSPENAATMPGAEIIQAAILIAEALKIGRVRISPDASVTVDGIQVSGVSTQTREDSCLTTRPANKFHFDGKTWTLQYAGMVVFESDRVGLHYIKQLIQHPRAEIHATELVTGAYGEPEDIVKEVELLEDGMAIANRDEDCVDSPCGHMTTTEFRDEILSDDDRAFVNHLLGKAKEELDALKTEGRIDQIEAKETEIEKVEDYLRKHRFGDKNTHFDGRADKDRKSVAKAIKDAIGKLAEGHPSLAKHLRDSITTGGYCSYSPEAVINWQVANQWRPVSP